MTSAPSASQPPKRKHHANGDLVATPSASRKKEKRPKTSVQATTSVVPPSEDPTGSQKSKLKSPGDKGKSRASDQPSEFRVINASLVLSIPPVFASDLRAGAEEMLDSMVMRYIPALQGVLLAHTNLQFLSQTASIHGNCPFAVCNVGFDATVWSPRVSMKLVGRVNLCSPDHISLLVHRTFNASIPRHHIPRDQWVFEYGAAENDPEFAEGRDGESGDKSKSTADGETDVEMRDADGEKPSEENKEAESSGRWIHHLTGSKLGNPDGYVEFTVIGLTVANEMLSLQGSIQPDPFSPDHVPHAERSPSPKPQRVAAEEAWERVEKEQEEDSDQDEDGFVHLAQLTDEARATQKAQQVKEEAEQFEKKAKKRKRESGRDGEEGAVRTGKKKDKKTKGGLS